jgi:hypothetical protein
MPGKPRWKRFGAGLALALLHAAPGHALIDSDLFLLMSSFPPNVALLLDNSNSMNQIEWHPMYDPAATPTCSDFDNNAPSALVVNTAKRETHCGNTRTIFAPVSGTHWDGRYLNWYFSNAADPYVNAIETDLASDIGCKKAGSFEKYRRTRAQAAKQVLADLICQTEQQAGVRFGLAQGSASALPTSATKQTPQRKTPTAAS